MNEVTAIMQDMRDAIMPVEEEIRQVTAQRPGARDQAQSQISTGFHREIALDKFPGNN